MLQYFKQMSRFTYLLTSGLLSVVDVTVLRGFSRWLAARNGIRPVKPSPVVSTGFQPSLDHQSRLCLVIALSACTWREEKWPGCVEWQWTVCVSV